MKTHFRFEIQRKMLYSSKQGFITMQKLCMEYKDLLMGGISWGWLRSAVESIDTLWQKEAIRSIQIPVLIATGGDDQLIETRYNDDFVQQLPKGVHVLYREDGTNYLEKKDRSKYNFGKILICFLQVTGPGPIH